MAKQIACLFYIGGFDVTIWNRTKRDITVLDNQVKALKILLSCKKQNDGTFRFTDTFDEIPDALTIESIAEELSAKKTVFIALRDRLSHGYYTNSSSFAPHEIGDGVGGLHFFNPIQLKLVEYCEPSNGHTGDIATVLEYLKSQAMNIAQVKANRGYAANYLIFHEISTFLKLVEVYKYDVDTVKMIYGQLYGNRSIIDIVDIVGIDTTSNIMNSLKEEDPSLYLPESLNKALQHNILGRKNNTSLMQLFSAKP